MAAGDLVITRFNEGFQNFQTSDTAVATLVSEGFPTSQFDDVNYNLIRRNGGGKRQEVSIMVTGLSKT